jgi:hypothetical protein
MEEEQSKHRTRKEIGYGVHGGISRDGFSIARNGLAAHAVPRVSRQFANGFLQG